MLRGIEEEKCAEYLYAAEPEKLLPEWSSKQFRNALLFAVEGFEERSLGALRALAQRGIKVGRVVLGRYPVTTTRGELNAAYRHEFERLIVTVSDQPPEIADCDPEAAWIAKALERQSPDCAFFDISGAATKIIFRALDALAQWDGQVFLLYSEATEYWPTAAGFDEIRRRAEDEPVVVEKIAELVDQSHWLYASAHHVEIVSGHEGYDSGAGTILVAFLPFKCARLAAILDMRDYADYLLIAGVPRLPENAWREKALRQINEPIVGSRDCDRIPTFGHREVYRSLANLVVGDEGLLGRFDVHLGALGSKLQTVACWGLSRTLPAITVVTSIPHGYFPKAFSKGIGETWAFRLPNVLSEARRLETPMILETRD
jgi:hypothetical protein